MDYPVAYGNQTVGRVQVSRRGLYYHVACRCNISGQVMYRLQASCGDRQTSLGILVPMEQGFGLDSSFPVSRLGEGELRFQLVPRHDEMAERIYVPIRSEEPFAYLSRLQEAFLITRDGQQYAALPKGDEDVV